ncbi:hypothetical protein OF83DRAFT_1172417 [Amylostereum chailletii]|nr:hypothetical protein OF83DRAFT_1172417 [Amylostereum chailletii]
MDEPRIGDFCRDLCVALQLHSLRSLTVKVDALEQFVAFDWIESFGPARDVDRLFLSMNAADSFCAALATAVPPGPNVPQPQNPAVLFPSLEFLSFRDTWFGAQRDSDTATRLIHESLTLTLKARAAVGRVPKFVAMNWCDMRPWVEEWVEAAGSEAAREWKTVEWTEPGPDPDSQSQSEEDSVADSDAE